MRTLSSGIQVGLGCAIVVVHSLFGGSALFRGGIGFVVIISDETWVVTRWQSDALAATSSWTHTEAVVGITIGPATPGGLDGCQ